MFSLASDHCVDIMLFWVLLRLLNEEHEEQKCLVLTGSFFPLIHGPLAPLFHGWRYTEVISTINIERDHILETQ